MGDASGLNDALVSLDPAGKGACVSEHDTGIEAGQTMSNYSADGNFQVGSTFKVFTLLQWFKGGTLGLRNRGFGQHLLSNGSFKVRRPLHHDRGLPGQRPRG